MNNRNYHIDNIKAVLIFLVVFGHIIEPLTFHPKVKFIYLIIYSFHMPAFIFVSGYLCRLSKNKLRNVVKMLFLYIVMQVIYTHFTINVLEMPNTMQFYVPYWILWFLLAIAFYYTFVEFFDVTPFKIFLIIIIVLWVTGGNQLGYEYSLSRIVYFLPFFLIGYVVNQKNIELTANIFARVFIFTAFIYLCYILISDIEIIPLNWFYGVTGWNDVGVNQEVALKTRIITYMFSALGILFILAFVPRKKTIISYIGEYTLPIYLIHGFLVQYLNNKGTIYEEQTMKQCLITAIKYSMMIILVIVVSIYVYNYVKGYLDKKKSNGDLRVESIKSIKVYEDVENF